MRPSSSCSDCATPWPAVTGGRRRSPMSAARPSSRRTHRCRPATTRFPSTWSNSNWPTAGDRSNGNASQFLALGHYDSGQGPQFNMTALAMRTAGVVNAVSRLHGDVTRQMFAPLWPDAPPGRAARRRHHQWRPCADVGLAHDGPALRAPPRSALARPVRRPLRLAAHPRDPRRRAVGRAQRAARLSRPVRPRPRAAALESES